MLVFSNVVNQVILNQMSNKSSKKRNIIVSIAVFILLFLTFFSLKRIQKTQVHKDTEAGEDTSVLWNFAVVGDTQAVGDRFIFDTMYPLVIEKEPDILFHVGDLTFNAATNQPLEGIIDIQYWKRNKFGEDAELVEIHVAPGNHDDDNRTGASLYNHYVDFICRGLHRKERDGPLVWQLEPFNQEVLSVPGYCDYGGDNRQYVFSRGNIRFIMLDMPFYDESAPKQAWFKEKICESNGQSVTLAFLHESHFTGKYQEIIPFLQEVEKTCPDNNLEAILTGHGHTFIHMIEEKSGVHMLETAGMWWIRMEERGYVNGFMNAKVTPSEIIFYHTSWDTKDPKPGSPQEFLRIPGSFTPLEVPTKCQKGVEISVDEGYKLLTIPPGYNSMPASKFLGDYTGIKSLAYFSDSKWHIFKRDGESFLGDDFKLERGKSYFIKVDSLTKIEYQVCTDEDPFEHQLVSGWNMVAVKDETQASEFLDQVSQDGKQAKMIFTFSNQRYIGLIKSAGVLYGTDFSMDPTLGYFVLIQE